MKARRLPFFAIALALWLYFIACFAMHPATAIKEGRFIDPDNAMYLVETLDWLQGQSWYDRIEHRLNPPEGVPIHFSRLMELPYAAVIAPLQSRLGNVDAAIVAAAVVPPIFLLALFFALRFQARFFMPRHYAWLAAFVALFAQNMTFVFMPGQAGHHNFILLLIALATGSASMMLTRPREWQWAVFTGVILALALSIALESLPWLLLISAIIGFYAVLRGGLMATAANIFALTLAMTGQVLLALYKPSIAQHDLDLVTFSQVYVFLLFDVLVCFAVARLMRNRSLKSRITVTGIAACIGGGAFLAAFPELLAGPYGAVDPALRHFLLPNIGEAIPLIRRVDALGFVLCFLPWSLLALSVCVWQIRKASPRRRHIWILLALLETAALALAALYQARYASFAQLFGIIPIAFLIQHVLRRTKKPAARLIYALPALLAVVMPALTYGAEWTDILLFPMQSFASGCDIKSAADMLSKPPYYDGTPKLIMNTVDEGPELLLRTSHNILSAPYHTNVSGNLDGAAFFRTPDAGKAEKIIRKRGADYVLLCRQLEATYLVPEDAGDDYILGPLHLPDPPPFAFQLTKPHVPNWLRPADLGASDIVLFRVVPQAKP
jgi:hypothetical protein